MTGGYIFIHAAPNAMCPHVTWMLENLAKTKLNPQWVQQGHLPGMSATTIEWQGSSGQAAQFASALFGLGSLYFEITERATPSSDASRYMHTPSLGIFHAHTDVAGNFVITEEKIKHACEQADKDLQKLQGHLALALGQAWDQELEPLRRHTYGTGLASLIHARFA